MIMNAQRGVQRLVCLAASASASGSKLLKNGQVRNAVGRRAFGTTVSDKQLQKPQEVSQIEETYKGMTITLEGTAGRPVYLDAQATTCMDHRVADAMLLYWTNQLYFSNPTSQCITLRVRTLLDEGVQLQLQLPIGIGVGKSIELPMFNRLIPNKDYKDPLIRRSPMEDPTISRPTEIEEPVNPNTVIEKRAARLIVIRRTKMNKHKLRKLRKKMKYVWAKVKQRREMRKEKAFLNSKMELIEAAKKFDAKEYVAGVIRKAKEEPIPYKWQDPLMPEWYKEQEMLKENKQKRYQKMVNLHINEFIKVRNKP